MIPTFENDARLPIRIYLETQNCEVRSPLVIKSIFSQYADRETDYVFTFIRAKKHQVFADLKFEVLALDDPHPRNDEIIPAYVAKSWEEAKEWLKKGSKKASPPSDPISPQRVSLSPEATDPLNSPSILPRALRKYESSPMFSSYSPLHSDPIRAFRSSENLCSSGNDLRRNTDSSSTDHGANLIRKKSRRRRPSTRRQSDSSTRLTSSSPRYQPSSPRYYNITLLFVDSKETKAQERNKNELQKIDTLLNQLLLPP